VTEARPRAGADALEILREIVRRAGHETRNALNGVAVNVEVVRSRVARAAVNPDLADFAERASSQIGVASALNDALLKLVRLVLEGHARGDVRGQSRPDGGSLLELMLYGDPALSFVSDIEPLARRIGATVEQGDRSVILRLSPQDSSHSKV
jgi:hypothetical protein